MKVSCDEGVASHVGPESCGDDRKVVALALTGESAGRVLSLENLMLGSADVVLTDGRQQWMSRQRKGHPHSPWSETPCMHRSTSQGRKVSRSEAGRSRSRPDLWSGPRFEPERGTRAMHDSGKSDGFVVPAKFSNKVVGAPATAERMEGRNPAKGNLVVAKRVRTQCRVNPLTESTRVRRVARANCALLPEVRARCGNSARRDLCGGRRATAVPTATVFDKGKKDSRPLRIFQILSSKLSYVLSGSG
jgi:hypothetical protein